MSLPLLISLIFFITFAIYTFSGIYIINLNSKSILNRVFFAICVALSVWSFSFSIFSSAHDYETALLWRRVSSFGWGVVYSVLLHFILILTERDKILKTKWIYMLLYLPAVVNIFIFGLYNDIATEQYYLVNTVLGWTNIYIDNFWNWYFTFYYIGFTIVGLSLIHQWGIKSNDPKKKNQMKLLLASSTIAFIMGSMTDSIFSSYLSETVPQIAPVIILIPIIAILFCINKFGLMLPLEEIIKADEGKILNRTSRVKIYEYLTISFIIGSMLNFVALYFIYNSSLKSTLLFSSFLFIIALIIQLIQKLKISEDHQDDIFTLILMACIPIVTLRFIEYASITVWAVPFIFVILSVVLNKRKMAILLGVVILLTQVWVWIKAPLLTVQVDGSDHIIRLGLFSISIWLALNVNQIYIKRLEENEEQIKLQKMISQISADFVNANESNINDKINGLLEQSGTYSQAKQSFLLLFSKDLKTVRYTHEWCNYGVEATLSKSEEMSLENFKWGMNHIINNRIYHIDDVEILPEESFAEKQLLQALKIKSFISITVTNNDRVLGILGFSIIKKTKNWLDNHQDMFKILANILSDTLVKVEAEREINYMAYYDALTGLPNRALLKNRIGQSIHLAKRSEKLIGMMFIDLDSFKIINDTMGHAWGDEVLKKVSKRLTDTVRQYDTVSRFGGDEFIIMFTQVHGVDDIHKMANNVMKTFEKPFIVNNQEYFITSSAGIAVYPIDGEDSDTLIKNADLAMYASKDGGKNQYILCSSLMKEDILKKIQLTNSLYRAQERNEFVLYYQPQVSVETKEIIGVEALIRWEHPELGMISPANFIPLAEQTGLINPIGEWVLETACRQNKIWQNHGLPPIRMAVNLSVEQFKYSNLTAIVKRTLEETGLLPEYLELEITESIAIKESDYFVCILNELKMLGVSIAIDDFGTAYSSLSRLKELPIDRVKMDMQFVQGISLNKKDESIIEVIIQMAKGLGLKVIAEGVETESQLKFLTKKLCDEVQGYYYFRPMPAEDIQAVMLMRQLLIS